MGFHVDRRVFLGGAAALGAAGPAWAKAPASYPALQALLDRYIDGEHRLPGMVIAVKRGGEPVRYLSEGTLAIDSKTPVGPDSLFRIYSMTKPITGMVMMKLIEDGRLRLDQPVAEIVPELRDVRVLKAGATDPTQTEPLVRPILIRHLLTHTAGLGYSIIPGPLGKLYTQKGIVPGGRTRDLEPGADLPPVKTLDELAQRLGTVPLLAQPGTRWSYSVGLDVCGLVVQRVSRMGFSEFLQARFFEPLRMRDTDFIVPAAKVNRFASVNMVRDGKLATAEAALGSPFTRDRDLPSGGGGLVSTASDYTRFTSMLLNEGQLDGRRVLKPETVRLGMSNLLPEGVQFRGFGAGPPNGFGAGGVAMLPGGTTPGAEPAGSYWWFGIAGTQMWVDPVNKVSVVCMLQMNPNRLPIQAELRQAAYKDLAAVSA